MAFDRLSILPSATFSLPPLPPPLSPPRLSDGVGGDDGDDDGDDGEILLLLSQVSSSWRQVLFRRRPSRRRAGVASRPSARLGQAVPDSFRQEDDNNNKLDSDNGIGHRSRGSGHLPFDELGSCP